MRIVSQLGSSGYRSDHHRVSWSSSDEPLLWGRLDHVVQLQPGRGQLLRGRLVLALGLSLLEFPFSWLREFLTAMT